MLQLIRGGTREYYCSERNLALTQLKRDLYRRRLLEGISDAAFHGRIGDVDLAIPWIMDRLSPEIARLGVIYKEAVHEILLDYRKVAQLAAATRN